jgi:sarcosine/dimethylglycine N-methyltransferase
MSAQQPETVVATTRDYYDGTADTLYREIWGENIHMGRFAAPDEDLPTAMARTNRDMAARVGLVPDHYVLDVGCGYGGTARYLAREHQCRVLATNISWKELEYGRQLTHEAGLDHRVHFDWADFHDLQYAPGTFDFYWSQEAFLHAADKRRVLGEAHRVLKPGGRLVFSELVVRRGTPEDQRQRIYDRVGAPEMWDTPDYEAALTEAGFRLVTREDWSEHVAPSYDWVRRELERRRAELEPRVGRAVVERTAEALAFWVEAARAGTIGWVYAVADRPA